jgi:uncharacterized protein
MLASVGLAQLALVWAVVVLAAVLRAFTGFGFGLAAVPVFALLMAPTQAVVLSSALTLAVSLLTLSTYWGRYPFKPLLPMLAMALLGTLGGAFLLTDISPRQFRLWIGLGVIASCIVLSVYRPGRHQPGLGLGAITGLVSGLLNGAFAIPGPPVIIYTMATESGAVRSRALLMTFFLFSAMLALATYAVAGFVTPASPALFALAFPAMWVGDKLGHYLFGRYGTAMYRRMALVVLLGMGVVITITAI